jgi:acyl-CoA thioester hydrolase
MGKSIISCEIGLDVPFFDVDLMEIVWHGHYAKYFEMARCTLLDKIGYGYMAMRASGYSWPVVDLRIRYARPAHFNQKIRVQADIVEWQHRLKITYQIIDQASGVRLTRGYTSQVAIDMATHEMCFECPEILWQKIGVTKP